MGSAHCACHISGQFAKFPKGPTAMENSATNAARSVLKKNTVSQIRVKEEERTWKLAWQTCFSSLIPRKFRHLQVTYFKNGLNPEIATIGGVRFLLWKKVHIESWVFDYSTKLWPFRDPPFCLSLKRKISRCPTEKMWEMVEPRGVTRVTKVLLEQ